MGGGRTLFLCVLAGVAGGLLGHGVAQALGIAFAIDVLIICADEIVEALRERR